jgi:hypothetical protein
MTPYPIKQGQVWQCRDQRFSVLIGTESLGWQEVIHCLVRGSGPVLADDWFFDTSPFSSDDDDYRVEEYPASWFGNDPLDMDPSLRDWWIFQTGPREEEGVVEDPLVQAHLWSSDEPNACQLDCMLLLYCPP